MSYKNVKRKFNKNELLRLLEEHSDWYLREFAEKLGVCFQSAHKMFKKLGLIWKNRSKKRKET
ncbi:MAG: IS630 transposase-related protein [Spirochaetaceae bacterium]|nr:IS630 transposase-related protein [Spirochaetaceae bacterium]